MWMLCRLVPARCCSDLIRLPSDPIINVLASSDMISSSITCPDSYGDSLASRHTFRLDIYVSGIHGVVRWCTSLLYLVD